MDNFETARLNMVESQIRPSDVTDRRITNAIAHLPREVFVPASLRSLAYMDDDIEVGGDSAGHHARYLMAPRVFAKLVQAAGIRPDDIVLDVGSATGYSTAVLAKLAEAVVGLEVDEDLAERASKVLMDLEIDNAVIVTGALEEGYEGEGPYNVIILNGSIPVKPERLLDQLKNGGRLVAVMGDGEPGQACLYQRIGDEISSRFIFDAGAKHLPGFSAKREFVF